MCGHIRRHRECRWSIINSNYDFNTRTHRSAGWPNAWTEKKTQTGKNHVKRRIEMKSWIYPIMVVLNEHLTFKPFYRRSKICFHFLWSIEILILVIYFRLATFWWVVFNPFEIELEPDSKRTYWRRFRMPRNEKNTMTTTILLYCERIQAYVWKRKFDCCVQQTNDFICSHASQYTSNIYSSVTTLIRLRGHKIRVAQQQQEPCYRQVSAENNAATERINRTRNTLFLFYSLYVFVIDLALFSQNKHALLTMHPN